MTLQITSRKVLPLSKGMRIEALTSKADGLGRYWVQQIKEKSTGLHFIDVRTNTAYLRIIGTITKIEISNTHYRDDISPSNRHIFLVYITLEDESVEEPEYPVLLRTMSNNIIVTNLITRKRHRLSFKKNETYDQVCTRVGVVNKNPRYLIKDEAGQVIGDQLVQEDPVDAFIHPDRSERI